MSLPHYVAPVLTVVGTPALLFTIMRYGPDAVLRLLAGTVAVLTRDEQRGERCLEVLRILRRGPEQPPDGYGVPTGELPGPSRARRAPRPRVRSRP